MNRPPRPAAPAILALALGLGLLAVGAVAAEPTIPGLYLDQGVQASYNPLGLQSGTKLFYRLPLVRERGILWESTRIDLGLVNNLSPAYDFVGGFIDIEPIAVFDLAVKALFTGYFKALGYGFRELAGYSAAYSERALEDLPAKDAAGAFFSVSPTFKIALGPLALLDTLNFNYFKVDGGSGYFYEAVGNLALAKSGLEVYNEAYALWAAGPGFLLGVNDTYMYVPDSDYASHAVHAVGVWTSSMSPRQTFYAALLAGVYLRDRYLKDKPHVAGQAGIVFSL